MKGQIRFPLRYKILLLLLVFTTLALVIYFILAVRVFQSDKVAYVFDSSLSIAKGLSNQVQSELVSINRILKPLLKEYNSRSGKMSDDGWLIFSNEDLFQGLAVFQDKKSGPELMTYKEKSKGLISQVMPYLKDEKFLKELKNSSFIFRTPFGQDNKYFFATQIKNEPSDLLIFAIVENHTFSDQFSSEGSQKFYLVDEMGRLLFRDSDSEHLAQKNVFCF